MENSKQTVGEIITELEKIGYLKSIDSIGDYLKGGDLYSRQVSDKTFVVFNHYNKGKKESLQGFDCWISEYNAQHEIGKVKAIDIKEFKLSFDFNEDWSNLRTKMNEIKESN